MKTLFTLFFLLSFCPLLKAQDAELIGYEKALAGAIKLNDKDSIAAAYCHLSEYYAYRRADSTRYYCNEGLKYVNKDRAEPYMTLIINHAISYMDEGNVNEALRRNFFTLEEAKRLNYSKEDQSSILASIGVNYRRKEMPDSALVYYKRALGLLENSGPEAYDEKSHLLTCMAILYANTSRLKEADSYVRRAVEIANKCTDMDMVLYAASTAGAIQTLRGNNEEGARMMHSALAKAREQNKPKFILKSMTYLLSMFYRMNNKDSINYYVRESEKQVKKLPESSVEVLGFYETLSQIYTKMGLYKESLAMQQRLLSLKDSNAQTPLNELYLNMAHNYKGLKDYLRASEYYEKAYNTSDSLHAEEINTELSELSVKYETQEKELEIARLTQEQLAQKAKTMQWGIIAAIAVFALLLSALYYIFRRKRIKKEEELKIAQSYIDGLERERTRLAKDLHDGVCNDLLGIGMQMQYMQPTDESKQELLKLLESIRGDVRCISHELMPPKFQYATLAETVETYVEKLTIPATMQLAFSKENEGAEWRQVPEQIAYEVYRILQELLANVLKHSGATEVYVRLTLNNKMLILEVTNNGKWFSDVETAGKGIGLVTIRERIKMVDGVLLTDVREGRQVVKLDIPLSIE